MTYTPRILHRWLLICMTLVACMVLIGGLTRLTESGLSIVKWKLVEGTLPPLSAQAWGEEFADYQTSPQYQQVNHDFTLADFQKIYWLEYLHRLIGRLVGLAIFLPYIYFVILTTWKKEATEQHGSATRVPLLGERSKSVFGFRVRGNGRATPSPDAPKSAPTSPQRRGDAGEASSIHNLILVRGLMMTVLVALQGTVGWIMVASGLHDEPRVAPLKLALHLSLAFSLFLLMLWTDWQLRDLARITPPLGGRLGGGLPQGDHSDNRAPLPSSTPMGEGVSFPALAIAARALFALIFLQIVFGALVAGLRAGLSYNTYPLMDGKFIPEGLWNLSPWWRNHLESILTVQFQHRMLAMLVVISILTFTAAAWKRTAADLRGPLKLILIALALQFTLGIATLLSSVNILLASAHQLGALLLLSAALQLVYRYPRFVR